MTRAREKTCQNPTCGKLFAKHPNMEWGRWEARKYCSQACIVGSFWTEEKVELALKMRMEGHSPEVIGRRIGTTRNAVIGKLHRMFGRSSKTPMLFRTARRPHKKRDASLANRIQQMRCLAAKMAQVAITEPVPSETPRGVHLLDLDPKGCRWPINESRDKSDPHLFCNQRKGFGLPYCDEHCLRAFDGIRRARQASLKKEAA